MKQDKYPNTGLCSCKRHKLRGSYKVCGKWSSCWECRRENSEDKKIRAEGHAQRKKNGVCANCGDVRDLNILVCSVCKEISKIKRQEREPANPLCVCGRRRIRTHSAWATCWECRREKVFYSKSSEHGRN